MSKLFLLALAAMLTYFFARTLFKPVARPAVKPKYQKGESEPATEMVQDPVCGMFVDPSKAVCFEHRGACYYFCSDRCAGSYREKMLEGRA